MRIPWMSRKRNKKHAAFLSIGHLRVGWNGVQFLDKSLLKEETQCQRKAYKVFYLGGISFSQTQKKYYIQFLCVFLQKIQRVELIAF